jgi:hypothetical protein
MKLLALPLLAHLGHSAMSGLSLPSGKADIAESDLRMAAVG